MFLLYHNDPKLSIRVATVSILCY